MKPISRAIMSVTDKSGLVEFAKALAAFPIEVLSTGGTAKVLREAGLTGAGSFGFHRFSGNAGRPGQNVAP